MFSFLDLDDEPIGGKALAYLAYKINDAFMSVSHWMSPFHRNPD